MNLIPSCSLCFLFQNTFSTNNNIQGNVTKVEEEIVLSVVVIET